MEEARKDWVDSSIRLLSAKVLCHLSSGIAHVPVLRVYPCVHRTLATVHTFERFVFYIEHSASMLALSRQLFARCKCKGLACEPVSDSECDC